ncbi:MAG: hypothetical protein NTU53_15080 [Planctomycetota bacterium]|nr:hypothetical protein [Planctomycetota bacterium]
MTALTPEQNARQKIDRHLQQCGWVLQDYRALNISASPGVAVREFPLKTGHADYMLYVAGKAIGVIEAKPQGHALTGVEIQRRKGVTPLFHPAAPRDPCFPHPTQAPPQKNGDFLPNILLSQT